MCWLPLLLSASMLSGGPALSHFRPLDPLSRELLAEGRAHSGTVQTLVAGIDQSDIIVYISTSRRQTRGEIVSATRAAEVRVRGQIQFLASTDSARIVHLWIRVPDSKAHLIAALAHEFQHIIELTMAPTVHDAPAWLGHLRTIGYEWQPGLFETRDALAVERAAFLEVQSKSIR